jgi:hypothetical protein
MLRQAMTLVIAGFAVGMTAVLFLGRFAEPALFQVSSRDPQVLGSAAVLVGLVSSAAALLPSMRASRVDPTVALRAD